MTFGKWAEKYFAEATLAESTRAMRKSVYDRNLAMEFGRLKLEEITPSRLLTRCEKIKERVRLRLPFRHATSSCRSTALCRQGAEGSQPGGRYPALRYRYFQATRPRADARGNPRVFKALERTPTLPTLRLAVKFMLLTMVRKSEFILATWDEVDFNAAVWTIPKERMKAGRAHNVYLSQQALDILVTFKTCFGASSYLHPGRYESELPISAATLNRVIDSAVKLIHKSGTEDFESLQYTTCGERRARNCMKPGLTATG